MRRIVMLFVAAAATLPSAAADPTGRWSGAAQVPGREVRLVVDLARDGEGAWTGSLIIPGFDVKGAPLGNIRVEGDKLSFDAGDALGAAPDNATFTATIDGPSMRGELRQAGNAAPFALTRTGAAQVDPARRSTAVARETEGRWIGEYEMNGYPRHVTVDIANHAGAPASVDFVVVGKATTKVPVDFVSEAEGMLRLESSAYRITFEGRVDPAQGRIVGTFENGPFELPLTLRREGKAS
ncbi:MAG TPA: hypothetical protein VMG61_12895 [Usitatibacter sp.]|nr:hypothetical protein [Usitatibacter sp.]